MKKLFLLLFLFFSFSSVFTQSSNNQWTWINGNSTINQTGVYGTKGTAASTNKPGARQYGAEWTDAAGNLWLLGGTGYATTTTAGDLNDLWKYSTATGQWTWMNGNNSTNQIGVYGTQGVATTANTPGARTYAANWTDLIGNLWLLGGSGYAASGTGTLNDMWKYSISAILLPVQFTGFTAHKQEQTVWLNWGTAREENSHSFVVERSLNGAVYDSIGVVRAMGMASAASRYGFVDRSPVQGINFYRLQQRGPDGQFVYSTVVKVFLEEDKVSFAILQNPVQHSLQLSLQLPAAQKLILQVRDINGLLLLSEERLGSSGSAVYTLPVDQLAKGTYVVSLQSANVHATKLFVKQ